MNKTALLVCTVFCFLFSTHLVRAQYPAVFSQFLQNPFQFNPSYAASSGVVEGNLFYRKQWMGIENAPEAAAINLQAPVGRNVSLGLSVISNNTVLLRTYGAMATFGYRARFGYQHHLNFGISGGLGMNSFDFEAVANTNDPALIDAVENSQYLTGQVGINYQFKNFNIGFALPNLFDSKVNTVDDFQEVEFNVWNNKFGSASYSFNLKNIQLTPVVIYRAIDNYQSQWEGMLMATYKGFLWVGASYRDGYGVTGFIGIRIKNKLRLGYAYEYPTGSIKDASSGSHEIFVGALLGKKNREEIIHAQDIKKDSLNKLAQQQKPEVTENKTETQPEPVVVIPVVVEPVRDTTEKEDLPKVEEKPPVITYYLVVGVYKLEENAQRNLRSLKSAGVNANILYVEAKAFYYIYLSQSLDRNETLRELEKVRLQNKFYGAWVYSAK